MSETRPAGVRHVGRIPTSLRGWCDRHAHQVAEVDSGDGYATVIEPTVKQIIAKLRDVTPCECSECRRGR